jgi:prevent-host-death family protein
MWSHLVIMATQATISRFKARLSAYLRLVRKGQEVIVTNRDEPVARLVPYDTREKDLDRSFLLPKDPTAPPLGKVKVKGIPYRGTDAVADLIADRRRR